MTIVEKMRVVLESSCFDIKEKIVVLGVLANGEQSIEDLHNYTSISKAMLERLCNKLVESGYFVIERKVFSRYSRKMYNLTNKLFEQNNSECG